MSTELGGTTGGGSGTITSVNGDTGPAVSLDLDDIPDGALYGRVSAVDLVGPHVQRLVDENGDFLNINDVNGVDTDLNFDGTLGAFNFNQRLHQGADVSFGRTTSSSFAYSSVDIFGAGNNAMTGASLVTKTAITGGGDTITLPDPTLNAYVRFEIKDTSGNAGTDNITVSPFAAETMDGAASMTITANHGLIKLFSDGVNWFSL